MTALAYDPTKIDKPGRYTVAPGLSLIIDKARKSWVFIYVQDHRRKQVTIGFFPRLSLDDAKAKVVELNKAVAEGREIVVKIVPRQPDLFTPDPGPPPALPRPIVVGPASTPFSAASPPTNMRTTMKKITITASDDVILQIAQKAMRIGADFSVETVNDGAPAPPPRHINRPGSGVTAIRTIVDFLDNLQTKIATRPALISILEAKGYAPKTLAGALSRLREQGAVTCSGDNVLLVKPAAEVRG